MLKIYSINNRDGIRLIPIKYPHAFTYIQISKDINWMLGFHGTELDNCDGIYDEPTIFLINLETGETELNLPVSFSFRPNSCGYCLTASSASSLGKISASILFKQRTKRMAYATSPSAIIRSCAKACAVLS